MRPRALVLVALVIVPQAAWPQGTPLGPEFRVNTYTTSGQSSPAISSDAGGNFVVVWRGDQDPGDPAFGVFGQRFAGSGTPLGPEFRANSYTTGPQRLIDVSTDPGGNFVVAWTSPQDADGYGVFAQRYA